MADAKRDSNFVTTLLAVSNVDGVTPVTLYADPVTHRLLTAPTGSGSGDVVGPASATDNAIARFDLTTGKLIQNSAVTISDTGAITVAGTFTLPIVDGTNLQVLQTNGAGVVSWQSAGSGTVTASGGALTSNSIVLGAGTTDTKVVAGITTDGVSVINLGVNATTIGKVKMFGNTSGDVTIQPTAAAGTATVQTLPATTGTLVNRVTTANGVSASNTDGALTVTLGAITPTTVNGNTLTTGSSTYTGTAGKTYTFPTTTATIARTDAGQTFTGTNAFGVITATTLNGNTFTTGTYTLTGTAGKTLNFTNSLTLSGTDSTTMTFPTTSKTLAANDGSNMTLASQAIGDIITATSTTAIGRLADVATGQVLVSGGVGVSPAYSATPLVTSVDLSNTDTTLARVAAGIMSVEGETINGYATTATAGATTTLTITSARTQYFTGSSTQTVKLPTTSVIVGQTYIITNTSTGLVTVQSSGANTIITLGLNQTATFTALVATPTTAANWIANNTNLSGNTNGKRLLTVTQAATPAMNTDNGDIMQITGLAQAITSMTTSLTGTPNSGDIIEIQITDNGTARAITWGASFQSTTVTLPSTTVISTMLKVLFQWNATASKWDCIAVA